MDKDLIEDKLYQIMYQFSKRKNTPLKLYSVIIHKIHPFYDGNGRICRILFANDDNIMKLIDERKNEKNNNIKQILIVLNTQSLQKATLLNYNAKQMEKNNLSSRCIKEMSDKDDKEEMSDLVKV